MLKFHPYSILTGDSMVEFVKFCVSNNANAINKIWQKELWNKVDEIQKTVGAESIGLFEVFVNFSGWNFDKAVDCSRPEFLKISGRNSKSSKAIWVFSGQNLSPWICKLIEITKTIHSDSERSHCYFTRLNLKKWGLSNFAFQSFHRNPKRKEIFDS